MSVFRGYIIDDTVADAQNGATVTKNEELGVRARDLASNSAAVAKVGSISFLTLQYARAHVSETI